MNKATYALSVSRTFGLRDLALPLMTYTQASNAREQLAKLGMATGVMIRNTAAE